MLRVDEQIHQSIDEDTLNPVYKLQHETDTEANKHEQKMKDETKLAVAKTKENLPSMPDPKDLKQ